MLRSFGWRLGVVGLVLAIGAVASASPIEVGSGKKTAYLGIRFKDSFSVDFLVHFDGALNGQQLLNAAALETSLGVKWDHYTFGDLLGRMSYEVHLNPAADGSETWPNGGVEDWWHYWNRSGSGEWASSWSGAADRVLEDGDGDGWVFGDAAGPVAVPEPSVLGLLTIGCLGLLRRWRVVP